MRQTNSQKLGVSTLRSPARANGCKAGTRRPQLAADGCFFISIFQLLRSPFKQRHTQATHRESCTLEPHCTATGCHATTCSNHWEAYLGHSAMRERRCVLLSPSTYGRPWTQAAQAEEPAVSGTWGSHNDCKGLLLAEIDPTKGRNVKKPWKHGQIRW